MRPRTESQIIEIISKTPWLRAGDLALRLKMTPQAVHRHLRRLERSGQIAKRGGPPHTEYQLSTLASRLAPKQFHEIGLILASHPAVLLATLFGSQARGTAGTDSDIDVLVWLDGREAFDRTDLWRFWDRQARSIPWANRVSLVVKKWRPTIQIDTLLLDFPEEHLLLFERTPTFERLRKAVTSWRKKNMSRTLPSFGGTHVWIYNTTPGKKLSDIDFRLEFDDVA